MIEWRSILIAASLAGLISCGSETKKSKSLDADSSDLATTESPSSPLDERPSATLQPLRPNTVAPEVSRTDSLKKSLSQSLRDQNSSQTGAIVQNILALDPLDAQALNAQGVLFYRKAQWDAAQLFFQKALKQKPNSFEILNNMGLVAIGKKDFAEALKYFRRALQQNPEDFSVNANIGTLFVRQGDLNKASVPLETAYKKNPKNAPVAHHYALTLKSAQKIEIAEMVLTQAIKENPSNQYLIMNLAGLYIENKNQIAQGQEWLKKIKFYGVQPDLKTRLSELEIKAKSK